jgi:hypothetical protein
MNAHNVSIPPPRKMDVRMQLYGEIVKVEAQDDGAIKVVGVASTGAVDDADERVLPQAMKAALPAYMRFGALREMHGLSAAGATLSAQVDDDGATRIEALVVDPVAVRKVQMGVYKGFSIGGKVLARDPADRKIITKLKLNEISLVDRPCNPEAVIDMWKADLASAGTTPSNIEVIARAIAMAGAAGKLGRHTEFVVKAREALVREAEETEPPPMDMLEDAEPIEAAVKVGARNSADDLAHIQAAHDHMVDLGAQCGPMADGADGDDKTARADDLAKVLADNARLSGEVEAMTPRLEGLQRTVASLERQIEVLAAQPTPPKAVAGALRAVAKGEDANTGAPTPMSAEELKKQLDALPEEERGRLQLMAALRQPIPIGR